MVLQAIVNAFGRNSRRIDILESLSLLQGEPGNPGDPGPRGPKGIEGPQGKRGQSYKHNQLIKLPIHMITLGEMYGTTNTRRVMMLVKEFYLTLGINIQDSHSIRSSFPLTYENNDLVIWHTSHIHGPLLTMYLDPAATTIGPSGNNWLGQVGSFNGISNGTGITAGNHMDDKVASILTHEMGHWLLTGENADHEEETFLSEVIGESSTVTKQQKELLRIGAYKFGSY